MQRFKYSILAAAGILVLAGVLTAIGPKRVMAALGYTPVRDVDGPGRQPFAFQASVPFGTPGTFTVPAGKRLIVTTVGARTLGTDSFLFVDTTVNGVETNIAIPYTAFNVAGSFANLTGDALAHADPGTTVFLIQRGANPAEITLHGYLVDVP